MLAIIGLALLALSGLLLRRGAHAHSEASRSSHSIDVKPNSPPGIDGLKQHVDRHGRIYRYRVLNDPWRGFAASIGGVFHGLVGFSAGELSTVEQVFRGIPVRVASGNAHLIIAAASIAAAFTHLGVSAVHGTQVPWNILVITIPTVLVGGQIAALVAGRLPQRTLRRVLSIVLLFLGTISLYRASISLQLHLTLWTALLIATAGLGWFATLRRASSEPAGAVARR